MRVEWAIGRHGGQYGYGSAVGAFGVMTSSRRAARIANVLEALGVSIPMAFAVYYAYIESWTLAFSVFSLIGKYSGLLDFESMTAFLSGFQGKVQSEHFDGLMTALFFFLTTLSINVYVPSRGIARGIESLARIAIPLLFLFAVILILSWGSILASMAFCFRKILKHKETRPKTEKQPPSSDARS